MTMQQETTSQDKISLRDIAHIFFFKGTIFIFTFVGVMVAALLLVLLSPSIYETNARLVVRPSIEKPLVFDGQRDEYAPMVTKVDPQALNTVVFLLRSPEVLRKVVEKNELADIDDPQDVAQAVEDMRGNLMAEPLSLSNIVEVKFRGGDPQGITDQLSDILDEYIDFYIKTNQSYQGRLEFFDRQVDFYRNRYEQLTDELARAKRDLKMVDVDIESNNRLEYIKDLENRRDDLKQRITELTSRLVSVDSALANSNSERFLGLPSEVQEQYPALIEMERTLAQLIINMQRAKADFKIGSKPVVDAETQYRNMRAKMRRYTERIRENTERDLESIGGELEQMEQRITSQRSENGIAGASAVRLRRLELEHELAEENYKLYEGKREEARINQEKDLAKFANVSVVQWPQYPLEPWFPQRKKIMMFAVILALFFAIALTGIAYGFDQRIRKPEDITNKTKLKLLGVLDAQ